VIRVRPSTSSKVQTNLATTVCPEVAGKLDRNVAFNRVLVVELAPEHDVPSIARERSPPGDYVQAGLPNILVMKRHGSLSSDAPEREGLRSITLLVAPN